MLNKLSPPSRDTYTPEFDPDVLISEIEILAGASGSPTYSHYLLGTLLITG